MVAFEDVLSRVKTVLQTDRTRFLELLQELHAAQVFSTQFYRCLFSCGKLETLHYIDAEDLARKLSLPIWQKWDVSQRILDLALKKVNWDLDVPDDAENLEVLGTIDLPEYFNSSLSDFEEEFDPSVFDSLNLQWDADTTCTQTSENDKVPGRKRKVEAASSKQPRKKRCKKDTKCPERKNSFTEEHSTMETNTVPVSIHFPLTSFRPRVLPSSAGPTLQIIQTIKPISPFTLVQAGPTYLLVSHQPVSPGPHILPSSPADGTIAPPELIVSSPVGSSLDGASLPFVRLDTHSTIKGGKHQNISSSSHPTPHRREKRVRPVAKCVQDYVQQAKSHLKDACSVMRGGLGMESHYVDLQLVQRKLHIKSGKNANKSLEKELVALSDSERTQLRRNRKQLFPQTVSSPTQSMALFGKAGVGKTTFIQRLCLDWAGGDLLRFRFVFLLNCKVLDLSKSTYSLKDMLFDLSTSPRCEDSDAVFRHILRFPGEVLIIFDSFEDLKDFEGLLQFPAKSPTEAKYTIKQLFSGLFHKEILSGCTFLLATRPKDVLNQLLRKVDDIFQLCSFSPEDITEYVENYFKEAESLDKKIEQLKSHKYMYSLCSNPLLCRTTCFLLEQRDRDGDVLPSTLTDFYQRVISKHLQSLSNGNSSIPDIPELCEIAWAGLKKQSAHASSLASAELVDCCLKSDLLQLLKTSEPQELYFADLLMQTYLGALHLVKCEQVNEKSLVAFSGVQQKKRRFLGESQDVLPWFATGLIFQKLPDDIGISSGGANFQAKKKSFAAHLENLRPKELVPAKLLELFHCVYETTSIKIAKRLLKKLPDDLSFCGAQLCPADVYVISHLLQHATAMKRNFSINLQDTGITISDLRELVQLRCIKSFRAHTADAINLWQDLHQTNEELQLRSGIEKFTLNPFKATQAHQIENLPELLQIHREKKLPASSTEVPALEEGVPALRHLQRLEYELGSQNIPQLFSNLVDLLPCLESLQHLDLEKNAIKDCGAEKLADVLHFLARLRLLNLSQNGIGDAGVAKLAKALPSVPSLQTLSLYGNLISDHGAEHLALALPAMESLQKLDVKFNKFTDVGAKKLSFALLNSAEMRSLELWNNCIPYGVFEHLRVQDPRIRSL